MSALRLLVWQPAGRTMPSATIALAFCRPRDARLAWSVFALGRVRACSRPLVGGLEVGVGKDCPAW